MFSLSLWLVRKMYEKHWLFFSLFLFTVGESWPDHALYGQSQALFFFFTQACLVEPDWLSAELRVLLSKVNTEGLLVLPCCQTWWEENVQEKPVMCNGGTLIRHGICTRMHVAGFLFISLSVVPFIPSSYSLCSVSFSHFIFTLVVFLCFFLCLSHTFFPSFCHAHKHWGDYFWQVGCESVLW